jgi:hypothetical protein
MAKEKSRAMALKRRQKRKRDLAPQTDADNVESWGIGKQHVQKMNLQKGKICIILLVSHVYILVSYF